MFPFLPNSSCFLPTPKKWLLPFTFRLADIVIVPSSGGVKLMHSLGIPDHRVHLTPYVVDNSRWLEQAKQVDRIAVRQQWGIPDTAPVALFCAKLQSWKRPQDVIEAFALAKVAGSYLVIAGEGPLRKELEATAKNLRISESIRFLGFVNQLQLPATYCSVDLLVLPSGYEPFGVVVNEAMLCGCPVVVSDRVGAHFDLVHPGTTGFIYPCGDVNALAAILQNVLPNRERLKQIGEAAKNRMKTWSPHENVEALVGAIQAAVG